MSDADGHPLSGLAPRHHLGHEQLVGMMVLATIEVRHAAEALWSQFSMCHSISAIAVRFVDLDDSTCVGVIAFGVIFYEFLADWTASLARIFVRWRKGLEQHSP